MFDVHNHPYSGIDLKPKAWLVLGLILFLGLMGCKDDTSKTDASSTLMMGTCADCQPFEYHDTSTGHDKIIGMDIDLAQALAQELNMKLEIQDMDFAGLIPSLQTGRTDFVMALMTPTEERSKSVSFSDIYFVNRIAIVTTKNKSIDQESQLVGKKLGVQLGSTNELTAKSLAQRVQGLELHALGKLNELIQEVRSNRIDGVVTEEINAKSYTEANDDLSYEVMKELETRFAIVFPKNSPWVDKFNTALKKLKAEGKLSDIVQRWTKQKKLS